MNAPSNYFRQDVLCYLISDYAAEQILLQQENINVKYNIKTTIGGWYFYLLSLSRTGSPGDGSSVTGGGISVVVGGSVTFFVVVSTGSSV